MQGVKIGKWKEVRLEGWVEAKLQSPLFVTLQSAVDKEERLEITREGMT